MSPWKSEQQRKYCYYLITQAKKQKKKKPEWCMKMIEHSNPCWKGYEMIGYKMKKGKKVPRCVKK